MGLNAVARTFNVSKKTVIDWEDRLGELKPVLRLSAWLHQFIELMIEGDELYTLVEKNEPPALSQGWRIVSRDLRRLPRTLVLQDKSTRKTPPSRFLWELHCGSKDQQLFKRALNTLVEVISQTEDLSLFTDGERRYGNLLFDICHEVIRDGKLGRPPKPLPKGIRVRLKNKGAKKRVGRPRKKYEAPVPEHPQTETKVVENEIHANHVEGFNA